MTEIQGSSTLFESTYILFCKIMDLERCHIEDLGAKLTTLNSIVNDATKKDPALPTLVSLVGKIVLVPGQPRRAIDIASAVMSAAETAGIPLVIGVTKGRLERMNILGSANFVGAPLNLAARIASCPRAIGVCVTQEVKTVAEKIGPFKFDSMLTDQVPNKSGSYTFYPLVRESVSATSEALPGSFIGEATDATIIVFDIVKYSDGDHGDQVTQVFQCLRALDLSLNQRVEFIPTGDGGVIVVNSGVTSALQLVEALYLRLQEGSKPFEGNIQVRISVHVGSLQRFAEVGSVGPDIFECDAYNSYAEPHKICVSPEFWDVSLLGYLMQDWIVETHTHSKPKAGFRGDLKDYYLIYRNRWGRSSRPEVDPIVRQESEMPTHDNPGIKRDGEGYSQTDRVDYWVSEFRKGEK